ERIKLSEILVSTEKKNANDTSTEEQRIAAAQTKADDLLAQIRKGAKFEDIAKKYSDGPSAAQGGDLGYFNRGALAKELEDKTFAMKAGDVSDVIRTQHENKVIISSFVVVSKQVKPKKTGEPYLALTLGDRSGHVEAKMWDNVEDAIDVFDQDDFIKIKGLLNKYKNRFQITIHKVRLLGDSEVDFADYLPKTTKDIGELWKTLTGFVTTFQNQHLRALIELFMADPEIAEAY